jgi:hypothetical protein
VGWSGTASDLKPARYPAFEGIHNLVHSAAPPLVAKFTQVFEDDEIFYNRVQLGPLMISLKAKREIKTGMGRGATCITTPSHSKSVGKTVSMAGCILIQFHPINDRLVPVSISDMFDCCSSTGCCCCCCRIVPSLH